MKYRTYSSLKQIKPKLWKAAVWNIHDKLEKIKEMSCFGSKENTLHFMSK